MVTSCCLYKWMKFPGCYRTRHVVFAAMFPFSSSKVPPAEEIERHSFPKVAILTAGSAKVGGFSSHDQSHMDQPCIFEIALKGRL
jgi:hypothetical protein